MKTIEINLYSFNELSDTAKAKALEKYRYKFADGMWWDLVYYDAKLVGIQIESFDIYPNSIEINLLYAGDDVANKIMTDHPKGSDTYNLAEEFLKERDYLVRKHSDGVNKNVVAEENEYEFDNELDDLEYEFKKQLAEEYLSLLKQEYEYIQSDEYLTEMFEVNEYEFTEDGTIY
jgi:hypothetical protein